MEFCHDNPILRSPAIERLGQFIRERGVQWTTGTPDFERFEHELHEQIMTLERELLGEELARYDVSAEQVEVGGMRYRPVLTTPETYLTVAGPVSVMRYLYRPAGRESRSICPLEVRAGLMAGYRRRAARQAAFVLAHLTPAKAKCCLTNWVGCNLRGPA
jgi:hypothetical protein